MGVLYDYYRAASREAAVAEPQDPRATEEPVFDAVDAKWIDTYVRLGALAQAITGAAYTVGSVLVYPPEPDEEWEGPWIEELSADVRDTLAGADDTRLPEIARQWAEIDELSGWSPADLLVTARELVGLARRAEAEGQLLYCWMSL